MKTFKKVLLIILTVLPVIFTAVAVFFILPDTVGTHFGVDLRPDRWGSKYEAFIFAGIILLLSVLYLVIRSLTLKKASDEKKDRVMHNLDILDTIILLILVLFNALNFAIILLMNNTESLREPEGLAAVIISCVVGVVFILIGNLMPKTKRNAFIGMRMKFAMDTDEHWYLANRAGGVALVVSGLVTVAAGLLLRSVAYVFCMVGVLFITLTIALIYSYVKIKGEKKS